MSKLTIIKCAAIFSFAVFGIITFTENLQVSKMLTNGFVTSAQTLSGAELFKANCARCHGDDGKGDRGPDLTSEKRQAKWKGSDEKLVNKITNGGWGMPKFGKRLKPEEIKTIAGYVRSLK